MTATEKEKIVGATEKILRENREGVRRAELLAAIIKKTDCHPKTVNGYLWKLPEQDKRFCRRKEKGATFFYWDG